MAPFSALGLIVCIGFVLRSFNFSPEQYADALLALFCETNVDGLRGLQACIPIQSQPIFPSLLRHFFWYPVFGTESELIHRLPNLIYGHFTILASFWLGITVFHGGGRTETFSCGLLCAWVTAISPQEIIQTGDWRNYSWMSLASVFFFGSLLNPKPDPRVVTLTSWILISSHFFAIPLVGALWFAIAVQYSASRKWTSLMRLCVLAFPAAALFFTVTGRGVSELFGGVVYNRTNPGNALDEGLNLFLGFGELFGNRWGVGLRGLLFAAVLAFSILRRSLSFRLQIVVISIFAMLAELILLRHRSDYAWWRRYYSPFFGLGIAFSAVLLRELNDLTENFVAKYKLRSSIRLIPWFLVMASHAFSPGLVHEFFRASRDLRLPSEFHSSIFRDFQKLRATQRPILVVLMIQDFHTYPWVYLNLIGGGYTSGFAYARFPFRGDIRNFLRTYPNAQIVLAAGMFQMEKMSIERKFQQNQDSSRFRDRVSLMRDFNALIIDRVDFPEEISIIAKDFGIMVDPAMYTEQISESGTGYFAHQPKRERTGLPR